MARMPNVISLIAVVVSAFSLGFAIGNLQTRRALAGWNTTMADNARLIEVVKTTTATLNTTNETLGRQNATVEELLAEKRAAWGIPQTERH